MYLARGDLKFLRSQKVIDARNEYLELFGVSFPLFNYDQWETPQLWLETLQQAVADRQIYKVESDTNRQD